MSDANFPNSYPYYHPMSDAEVAEQRLRRCEDLKAKIKGKHGAFVMWADPSVKPSDWQVGVLRQFNETAALVKLESGVEEWIVYGHLIPLRESVTEIRRRT